MSPGTTKQPPKINDETKIVSVCMCCFPRASFFDEFPEYKKKGYVLSHGICPEHKEEYQAQIRALTRKA